MNLFVRHETAPFLFSLFYSIASAAEPARSYDLVVVGGTPGGIACAVRAAREGFSVHLGGILSSGLGVWDSQWEGKRSPIYDETRAAFIAHYRTTYGEDSPQYRDALPGKTRHTNGRYEPHVAEHFLTGLVAREKNIVVLKSFIPVAVESSGAVLKSLTLRTTSGTEERIVQAHTFADCTYEGDLASLAKVPCRVAREARSEFNEPHAGLIFMKPVMQAPDAETARLAALRDALKLRKFTGFQQLMLQSTGASDPAVQACNYRTMLTSNPANRVHPTEWNIGESAGALAVFCLERRLTPRQVRNTVGHLADFQRVLENQGVELDWPRMETARSYYSHHNLELKDADTFYFGEAWRLK